MCRPRKFKERPPIIPAAAPPLPEESPVQQEIASARRADNVELYGTDKPKLRRPNRAGTNNPVGPAGIRM